MTAREDRAYALLTALIQYVPAEREQMREHIRAWLRAHEPLIMTDDEAHEDAPPPSAPPTALLDPEMTDEERAIWRATYAAAYVAEFDALEDHFQSEPRTDPSGQALTPFDRAMFTQSGERACTLADAAVRRLREWRPSEPLVGMRLGSWPKEWDDE